MRKKIKKLSDIYSNNFNVNELFKGNMKNVRGGCGCMIVGGYEDLGKGKAEDTTREDLEKIMEELEG